jgi:hypothetical protein
VGTHCVGNKSKEISQKIFEEGVVFILGRICSSDFPSIRTMFSDAFEIVVDKFNMLDRKPEGTPATQPRSRHLEAAEEPG